MFTDPEMQHETKDFRKARYGDIVYWATCGELRLPTAEEMTTLFTAYSWEYGFFGEHCQNQPTASCSLVHRKAKYAPHVTMSDARNVSHGTTSVTAHSFLSHSTAPAMAAGLGTDACQST